jgi:hypothetical protein
MYKGNDKYPLFVPNIKYNQGFLIKISGAAHRNICSRIKVEGAAHRDIEFNITVRCTFKTRKIYHFYKYYSALHLLYDYTRVLQILLF